MPKTTDDSSIQVRLSRDEALVLFEWIASLEDHPRLPAPDSAEQVALWRLEGQIEKTLTEILAPDYKEKVEASRRALTDQSE